MKTIRGGWAGVALLAAFTMMTSTAVAQDPPKRGPDKATAAKAQQRAAEARKKAQEAQKKAAEASAAAEAAEEDAAEAAGEEAGPEETGDAAPAEEASEASGDEAVSAEDATDAEAEEEEEQEEPVRRAPRARHSPYAPSPDARQRAYDYSLPYTMEYIEGSEVPPGYVKVERIRKGLVIGGAVTFGVTWLLSATAAAAMDEEEEFGEDARPLYIPLVGPFIAMGTLDAEPAGRAVLFLDGIAQVGGAAMFIGGLAATKTVLVRSSTATVELTPGPGNVHLNGSF